MSRPPHRLRAWLGGVAAGMLLLAFGKLGYEGWIVGVHEYRVLMFTDLAWRKGGADFEVFIDGKHARTAFTVLPSDSAFVRLYVSETVNSTNDRVTLELVPTSADKALHTHRFAIDKSRKENLCDAVVEVRGVEPTFLDCAEREYYP